MARVMVAGLCLGVKHENREYNGDKWTESTVFVLSGMESTQVRLGRDFLERDLPVRGDVVVLEATVDAYVTKKGQVMNTLTAIGRVPAVEEVLPASVFDVMAQSA